MKKILAILLAVAMIAALAACSGKTKASYNDAGYYSVFSITEDGETMSQAELEELGLEIYMELKDDGTGVINIAGDETRITWEDGSITNEGETKAYALAGGMLTLDLSEDGEEFILIFKKGTKPQNSSSGGIKGMLGDAGGAAPAEEPAEEPEEEPAEEPSVQGADFEPVGGYIDECYVEIIGAEQFKDIDGKDAIRFYLDFTNNSDEITSCWWECDFEAEQSGFELVGTYASYEDDVPEYGNTSRNVLPGVTIRCIEEFNFQPTGGPVTLTVSNYDGDKLTATFDAENLPGRPGNWEPERSDGSFTADLSDLIETDEFTLFIDEAEYAETYFDDEEVVRVYFEYTNNSDEAESCYMASNIYLFQNGIALNSSYSSEDLESDELYNQDVEPGETVYCSSCWELIDDVDYAPIEVVVENYSGDILGGARYSSTD